MIRIPIRCVLLVVLLLGACQREQEVSVESIQQMLLSDSTNSEALKAVRGALDRDPTRSDLQLIYGQILVGQREYNLALWPLREAARDSRFATRARLLIAETQLTIGNSDEALAALDEILAAEPDHRAARMLRANAHLEGMKLEDALEDADLLLDQDPDDIDTHLTRLRALLLLEHAEEAEDALEELKSRLLEQGDAQPPAMHARVCAAEAVFFRERRDRKSWFEKATGCADEYPSQHVVLQEVLKAHSARGEEKEALHRIEKALEETPEDEQIRYLLAEHHRKAGEAPKGEEILREGIAIFDPPRPRDWRALYEYFWQLGDFPNALDALEHSIKLLRDPSTADLLLLADTLLESGDLERAEEVSRQLGGGYDDLVRGRVFFARDDLVAARTALESGIRIWPNNPVARVLLAQIAARGGDLQEALDQYIEAYRIENAHNTRILEKTNAAKEIARIYIALGAYEQGIVFARAQTVAHAADLEGYELVAKAGARAGKPQLVGPILEALASLPGGMARAVALQASLVSEAEGPMAAVQSIRRWKPDLTRPENARVLEVFLDQLAMLDRHDQAIKVTTRAVAAAPEAATFHVLRARALQRSQADEDAVRAALGVALRLEPNQGPALLLLAEVEEAAGHPDAALDAYDRAAESDSTTLSVSAGLAAARLLASRSNREDEARDRLEKLLAAHPLESQAASSLAELAMRPGENRDLDRALEWASRAAQFAGALPRKDVSHIFAVLGRVWLDRGEPDKAREALSVALDAHADNTEAQALLDSLPTEDREASS